MALVPRLEPGTIFARDFKVVDLLAEGGMGAVYRVEQLSTHKLRALKLVSTRLASDPKGRQRFVREATVGASIDSEHAVEVIGAGIDEQSGRPWLAMELLDGADLGAVQQHWGVLSPGQLREVVGQLCHGLHAAHRAGVVHRDLKPANVFVARSRRAGVPFTVKILDFGIAKVVQESGTGTETDTVGSPLWMAPEQLDAQRPSPATDVWALGLLAFWALSGKHYWRSAHAEASTVQALFVEQLFKALDPPSQRVRELGGVEALPPGFDAWFLRCLQRDPSRRYPDAAQAGAALQALLPVDAAAAARLLPNEVLPPSTGRTQPQYRTAEGTGSEATLMGDPTGWGASAVVPGAALAEVRSTYEATRADPVPLGADLSHGPLPGHAQPKRPPRTSPVVVALSVALVVGGLLGGGALLWKRRAARRSGADEDTPTAQRRAEPRRDEAASTGEGSGSEPGPGDEGPPASSGADEVADATAIDLGGGVDEPSGPALELVVPLRHQLDAQAHDIDFLGWSPEGHRFALRVQHRDDDRQAHDRLELVEVHDALTGVMIESFLLERDADPGVKSYAKLSKAAAEAEPGSAWPARRDALRIHKRGPQRESASGARMRL
ncbi:MAG: serine/threonine protein kinase, partial [Myxococcales bacterium]|nr:serine/threonine protein kinase [Myxococcales bacterium]